MVSKAQSIWKRRVIRAAFAVVLIVIIAAAAIPWGLSTSVGRRIVLSKVNQAIAPGRLEAESLQFSWSGATTGRGVVLKDKEGKALVSAPSVVWDRSLWNLLADRPNYGTITLEGAECDITRRDDGSIDLVDALGIGPKPPSLPPKTPGKPSKPAVATLKIVNGSLRLRAPELPDVLAAERFDLTLTQPAAPGARTFEAILSKPHGEMLKIHGEMDGVAGLTVSLTANAWPSAVAVSGLEARGTLGGKAEILLRGGFVSASGDAKLSNCEAAGPALAGDRLAMDAVSGQWDISQSATGWTIRSLNLASPIGSLASDHPIPATPGAPAILSGKIDLAALAKQAPHALRLREGLDLRKGFVEVRVDVREDAGAQRLAVTAKLSDLEARDPGRPVPIVLRDPATLEASLSATGSAVTVERLGLRASGLDVQGAGDLDRGVKMTGHFDLAKLEAQFRDLVDLRGLDLSGTGRFGADYRREKDSYEVRYQAEVKNLKVLRTGAEPIAHDVVKLEGEVRGASDVSGIPSSWRTARIGLGLPDLAASASLSPSPAGLTIGMVAAKPMLLDGRPASAEARLSAIWTQSAIEIGELHLGMTLAAPAKPIAIAAKGRYDFASGSLILAPLPSSPANPVTLAPGGVRIGQSSGATTVEGGIVGDLAAVDRLWAAFSGSAPYGLDGPFGLAVEASHDASADRLDVSQLVITSRYGSSGVAGEIIAVSGLRVANLAGTLTIDPSTIDGFVASSIPDARVVARARPFHVRGPLSGEILRQIEADAGLDIESATVAGLKLGPAPVIARLSGGKIAIDPILASLNGGEIEIHSEVTLEEAGGATIHLLPGTAIRNAVVDDEMSERLLSYVAPVLHDATQVRGKISMTIARAEIPVGGQAERWASMASTIQFQDLVFGPGPLATEFLALSPMQREPQIRLDETIQVSVAKGRVYQKGLSIPIGRGDALALEGSVGFDRTLALRMLVPVSLGNLVTRGNVGSESASGVRVPIAIGGTFARPKIDRGAMAKALRQEGRSAIRREAESGVNNLIRKLGAEAGSPRK